VYFLDAYLRHQETVGLEPSLRQLVFSGGEPTLNSDVIFEVMEYVSRNEIRCIPLLLTNGLINPDVLERLIAEGFFFQISFDGFGGSLRSCQETGDVNGRVVETIKHVTSSGLPVALRAVITQENIARMEEIVCFAAENQVETVLFAPASMHGNARRFGIKRPPVEDFLRHFHRALDTARRVGVHIPRVELSRYESKGEFVELPKIVLFPDGSLTMMTIYSSASAPGAQGDLIGRCTMGRALEVDYERVSRLVENFLRNFDRHCASCDCRDFCRGRTIDNCYLFMVKENLEQPEHYFCDFARGLYAGIKQGYCHDV
jgi:uncharacterized protein